LIKTGSSRRLTGLAGISLGLAAALLGVSIDAARRRAQQRDRRARVEGVVRALGTADLALSSASRWLRHPSATEPGAPFADGPAILDADPAGALIGPPAEILGGIQPSGEEPGRSEGARHQTNR
jgi:hypothetical protein